MNTAQLSLAEVEKLFALTEGHFLDLQSPGHSASKADPQHLRLCERGRR